MPDDLLVSKGLLDESTGAKYNPATYPDHGAGLFFVGVEQDGKIVAYALNRTTNRLHARRHHPERIPEAHGPPVRAREHPPVGGVRRHLRRPDREVGHRAVRSERRKFVITDTYERPAGMANLNNEGFAIAPQAECRNGVKPVFWADDTNADLHALRTGTLNCTVPGRTRAPTPIRPDGHADAPPAPGPSPTPAVACRRRHQPIAWHRSSRSR